MDIRNPSELKSSAARALKRGREPKKLVTAYTAGLVAAAATITLLNFWLNKQIAGTGGLGNMGTRSILSTVQAILPTVQSVVVLGLEFGYLYGMLRIARGQYADHTDLKTGFRQFFPILRLTLLQGLIFGGIAVGIFYLSMQIFILTPWARPLAELLLPFVTAGNTNLDEATVLQAAKLMIPMFILFGVIYLAVAIPIAYRLRMANYALMDAPRAGALAALRESRKMMKGNCIHLLKLDISFWWFYLLKVLATALCYGDLILPMLGIELPFSSTVSSYVFYGLYLIALFATSYFLRNSVETTYVMAYEAIHEKKEDSGVVLGNIFDM